MVEDLERPLAPPTRQAAGALNRAARQRRPRPPDIDWNRTNAGALAALGVPAFACTPDLFPELMAAAIHRRHLAGWAASQGVTTAAPVSG